MAALTELVERIRRGEVVVIDGGTGTEIQRRGVAMHADTWCADANLSAPDVVRDVHRAYIDAGAELIIANTFATSPYLFATIGRADDLAVIDAAAVRLAREAAAGRVPVAGSMSSMRPMDGGTIPWGDREARDGYRRKADGLADAGADLIVMEMMGDADDSVVATAAAMATGLPVWVGISVERDEHGALTGWRRPTCPASDIVDALVATRPSLVAVMHTAADDTTDALELVRSRFDGPLGTYPESGYFAPPDWVFHDVITNDDLVEATRTWIRRHGVSVVGGCCGTTPEHIAALCTSLRQDDGARPFIS